MPDEDPFLLRLAGIVRAGIGQSDAAEDRTAAEIIDAVGCILRGADHPMVVRLAKSAERRQPAVGPFVSLATGAGSTLEHAITVDSVACHVDEFDSIHPASATVPASVVVPPALIVGSWLGSSGHQVLDAVRCGYDVVTSTAQRWGGSTLYQRGWWPTSTFGALGAAAAVGVLLDLDETQLAHALGIAAATTGGLLSADRLSEGHYLSGAHAAREGARAALCAAEGMEASWTLLDGPAVRAFGPVLSDDMNVGSVGQCVVKWYPCARPLHGVIEGLRGLRAKGMTFDAADTITVTVHPELLPFLNADSIADGPTEAAASAVFAVAAVLSGRESDPEFFRAARLSRTMPLPRVELGASEAGESSWQAEITAVNSATGEVAKIVGTPATTHQPAALRGKFMSNATASLSDEQAAALWEALSALEQAGDVSSLLNSLLGHHLERRSVPRDCT